MPTSTSSSPISNVGVPAAGTMHDVSARPIERPWPLTFSAVAADLGERAAGLGVGAGDLLEQHGHADAAPAGRVQRVLDRDVVVGHDRGWTSISPATSSAAISKFRTSPV